jgi:hypothetical protein
MASMNEYTPEWHPMKRKQLPNTAVTGLAAIGFALAIGCCGCFAAAQEGAPAPVSANNRSNPVKPNYWPYPERKTPMRPYWGIAHVHTS